jgi:glutamyl-tRNA reductase
VQGRTPHVVIVGAGDMAEQCGRALVGRRARITFVNRTKPRAQALCAQFGGEALALTDYQNQPAPTDVLLAATASPVPLFDQPYFSRLAQAHRSGGVAPPVVIDLSVPRNVAIEAAQNAEATLYDVDRMQAMADLHAQSRADAVAQARALVDDALDAYRHKETERAMGQAIARVRAHERCALTQELEALKASLSPHVVPEAWPHIERFARGLFGQLAHSSTRGLKALAHDHGPQALNAYLRGAGLSGPEGPATHKEPL